MRRKNVLPRVLQINWIDGLTISVTFNNGESRVIDFQEFLNRNEVKEGNSEYMLKDPQEFAKVEVDNNTLSWKNVKQKIPGLHGGLMEVPYEICPDTIYAISQPERKKDDEQIGRLVKHNRLKAGMTQRELAARSGTTRNYISRIENNRSDIELGTLRKIIEIGLGKKLEIVIK
ncbi:MAG: helix-turn-helix domain-containing protein [Bacteroidales bacterium]